MPTSTTQPAEQAGLDRDATLACDEVHWAAEAGGPFPGADLTAEIGRMEHSAKYRPLAEALRSGDVARVFAECRAVKAG